MTSYRSNKSRMRLVPNDLTSATREPTELTILQMAKTQKNKNTSFHLGMRAHNKRPKREWIRTD